MSIGAAFAVIRIATGVIAMTDVVAVTGSAVASIVGTFYLFKKRKSQIENESCNLKVLKRLKLLKKVKNTDLFSEKEKN